MFFTHMCIYFIYGHITNDRGVYKILASVKPLSNKTQLLK